MQNWQLFLIVFILFNIVLFAKAYFECTLKKNSYGFTRPLFPIGMFVWGDVFIFSIFWILTSLVSVLTKDLNLFLLIFSLFWVVRSLGETIYWFNQQFSKVIREPAPKVFFYPLFRNDSVWFVFQIIWQCVTVVSLVFSIYFANLWINSINSF